MESTNLESPNVSPLSNVELSSVDSPSNVKLTNVDSPSNVESPAVDSPKQRVERLDSLQSLPELELGENVFVKNSALVDIVNESLNDAPVSPEISIDTNVEKQGIQVNVENSDNKANTNVENQHDKLSLPDEQGVPVVFKKFLRRFSEDDRVVEDALEIRYSFFSPFFFFSPD